MAGTFHEPGSGRQVLLPDGLNVGLLLTGSCISWAHFKQTDHGLVYFGPCDDEHAALLNVATLTGAALWRLARTNVGRVALAEPAGSFFNHNSK